MLAHLQPENDMPYDDFLQISTQWSKWDWHNINCLKYIFNAGKVWAKCNVCASFYILWNKLTIIPVNFNLKIVL